MWMLHYLYMGKNYISKTQQISVFSSLHFLFRWRLKLWRQLFLVHITTSPSTSKTSQIKTSRHPWAQSSFYISCSLFSRIVKSFVGFSTAASSDPNLFVVVDAEKSISTPAGSKRERCCCPPHCRGKKVKNSTSFYFPYFLFCRDAPDIKNGNNVFAFCFW